MHLFGYWQDASNCAASNPRFYDDHDRKVDGSTPTQASLLSPSLIRCFTTIIPAWWNQQIEKVRSKTQAENSETKATLKRLWIGPAYNASVAFSRHEDKSEEIVIIWKTKLCFKVP